MKNKMFILHWLHGKTEEISGYDIADAFSKAGYGGGALGALDYYEEIPSTDKFRDVYLAPDGHFTYRDERGYDCTASFPLFLIRQAWESGMYLEDLADGFGPENGTMEGDWSGIRDSSNEAIERMLERALNFLF